MTTGKERPTDAADLRRKAQERLADRIAKTPHPKTEQDAVGLLNELQIHQIELEMQNEELQAVQAQVEASLLEYADLYEFAPVGYVSLDRGGVIRKTNAACVTLLACERPQLMDADFCSFVAPADRPAFAAFLQNVFQGRGRASCEVSILSQEIQPRYAHIEGTMCQDGQLCRVTIVDITGIKQDELDQTVLASVLRLANTPNHLHELMRTLTGFLQEWSGCQAVGVRLCEGEDFPYFETRGFPAEFVKAENFLCQRDLAGQLCRDEMGHPMLECMCGNILRGRFDPSKPFFTPHGTFWSNCTTDLLASTTDSDRMARTRNRCNGEGYESVALVPLRAGKTTFGLIQFNDRRKDRFTPESIRMLEQIADSVTIVLAQRQAEKAIRESEHRYRSLFENIAEGFAYCRMLYKDGVPNDFVYLAVNGAFETLTGLKDVVGKRASEAIPGLAQSDPELLEIYGRVATTGKPQRLETYVHALKEWFSISVYSPQMDHFIALFDVVTKRKRSEELLRQAQKMEAVGRLAAGVAHDFNNQLTIILAYCDMLLAACKSGDSQFEPLTEIHRAAERAHATTSHLLSFSRKQVLHPEPTDIGELLQAMRNPVATMIGEDIKLTIAPGPGVGLVLIDRPGMQQALMNLIVNARDAMPSGGELTLDARGIDLAAAGEEFPDAAPGRYVLLEVRDTGTGMDRRTLDRIFDPFFTTKEVGKGTGLGLPMVQGFVQQSMGFISLRSEIGQGTTVSILLPTVETPPSPVSHPPQVATPAAGGNGTILVVEDEDSVRTLIVLCLRTNGYRVLDAAAPSEAISMVAAFDGPIDLLLTDIVMPGMNGTDLARQVLSMRKSIRTLFITGYATEEAHRDAGNVLPKPFTVESLLAAVHRTIRQDAPPRQP